MMRFGCVYPDANIISHDKEWYKVYLQLLKLDYIFWVRLFHSKFYRSLQREEMESISIC